MDMPLYAPKISYGEQLPLEQLFVQMQSIPRVAINQFHSYSLVYSIETHLQLAWSESALFALFTVQELDVVCQCTLDGQPVWQDSCVELFIRDICTPSVYHNFEFNSQGICLAQRGLDRHSRVEISHEEYSQIERLPVHTQNAQSPYQQWSLLLSIPSTLLGCCADNQLESVAHLSMNAYKTSAKPAHWASLFPVPTPRPDFHRPEYFKAIPLTRAC
jgi:hypothetical protein